MITAETKTKVESNLIIFLGPKVDPIHDLGINATVTDKAPNELAWSATKGMHRTGASVLKSVAYDRMSLRADNLSYRMHRNSNAMSALCSQPVWQDGCAIDAVDESACGSFSIRSCKTRLGALCCINADRRVRWCRSIQANWGNRTVAADKHCIGGCDHLLAWLRHGRELLAPLPSLEEWMESLQAKHQHGLKSTKGWHATQRKIVHGMFSTPIVPRSLRTSDTLSFPHPHPQCQSETKSRSM